MGVTAVLKMRQVVKNLEVILALELLCAAQGIDFRRKAIGGEPSLGNGTTEIYKEIRSQVPFIEKDVYLKDHIDAVHQIAIRFGNSAAQ